MKFFAEIVEKKMKDNPKFFQVVVNSKLEAITKINNELANFSGLEIEKRFHKCFHVESGEKENHPCQIEKL